MKKALFVSTIIGEVGIVEEDGKITNIFFGGAVKPKQFELSSTPLLEQAAEQIKEYFSGKRKAFDFPINLKGTPFQIKVWEALRTIPFGQTATYKDIAKLIGNEKGFRAVGLACGKNPILLVVPCHRIISQDGKIGGFTGGINAKIKLLNLENINVKI